MTVSSGRGLGRGVTVAQSPAQLAPAAAQRDAREAQAVFCGVAENCPWYRAGDAMGVESAVASLGRGP